MRGAPVAPGFQFIDDGDTCDLPAHKLAALLEVSRALSESLELPAVMQVAVDAAVRVMELDTGAIYLLTADTVFLGATTPGLGEEIPDSIRRAEAADHPHIVECLRSRLPICIEDSATCEFSPAEQMAVDARGLRSILYVPLIAGDTPVGVVILGSVGRTRRFSQSDADLCITMSASLALAVANARLYEEQRTAMCELSRAYADAEAVKQQLRALATQLTAAEEHERRRIADELHDRVCQPLAVLKMKLQEGAGQHQQQPADATYQLALRLVDESLQQARAVMYEASPPYIFDSGLRPALEWLGQRTIELGVRCEVFVDGDVDGVEEDVRLFAFQAARELLMNVVKHSSARYASLTVWCEDGFLCVKITDDGGGFPTSSLDAPPVGDRGFGLFSLRERTHYIGGTLDIASAMGVGTTAQLRVPSTHCEILTKNRR